MRFAEEAIETTVKRSDNNIQLLCNIKNMKNKSVFCRFERLGAESFGINLMDGTFFENYRYYGNGLDHGCCGLEISNMKQADKAQWTCIIGLMDAEDVLKKIPEGDKRIYKYSSILDASDDWNKIKSENNLEFQHHLTNLKFPSFGF